MLFRALRWISTSSIGRRDTPLKTPWAVIGWWEARRVPFNLLVGTTGLVTAIAMLSVAWASERTLGIPIGLPDPPFFAILGAIAFGLAANVCYTDGWIAELIVRKTWPNEAEQIGPISFTLGLGFAVVLTLLPALLVSAAAIVIGVAQWLGYGAAAVYGAG
jgi:hypothetical protein